MLDVFALLIELLLVEMSKKKAIVSEAKLKYSNNALCILEAECDKFEELFAMFKNLTDQIDNKRAEITYNFENDTSLMQIVVTWMTLYYFLVDYYLLIVNGHVYRESMVINFRADIQGLFKYTIDKNTNEVVKKSASGLPGYLGYLTGYSDQSHEFWIYSVSYLEIM